MRQKTKRSKPQGFILWTSSEIRGLLLLVFAIILLLSLISFAIDPGSKNLLGLMGYSFGWALHALIGLSSYGLVAYIGWMGWRLLFSKPLNNLWLKHFYLILGIISLCMLLSLIENDAPSISRAFHQLFTPGLLAHKMRYHLGGALFFYLYRDLPSLNLNHIFNTVGVALVFSSTLIASVSFLFKIRLSAFFSIFGTLIKKIKVPHNDNPLEPLVSEYKERNLEAKKEFQETTAPESDFLRYVKLRIPTHSSHDSETKLLASPSPPTSHLLAIHPEKNLKIRPSLSRKGQTDVEAENPPKTMRQSLNSVDIVENSPISYTLPTPNLLANAKKVDQSLIKKNLKRQAEVLEETLLSFGIEAKVGQINCGPTITSFEVHPAIGVKVQKIKTLDNDIALNMEAKSIRIIAPIPGKAAVGIEVPNAQPQEVGFKEMLLAYQQNSQKFHIPILLGQSVNGDYVMSDLTKMPHCIIAGATGSGKSVCINTIIMSILLNAKPDQIKLLMVDPKKVELTPYSSLPHMLAPVITGAAGAAAALNWLVKEMEKRYEILKLVGMRNIDSFNKRSIDTQLEASLEKEIPQVFPYIVGIIDELADLMMVASQDIETPIARIAQMARAVGIHLILATQRPSREVITGLIKANFPTRISFKVASRVNSQIVLDETGAESLLGNGDLLFLPPGSSHLVRAQGAFIRDEDIQKVIDHICKQAPPNYLIKSFDHLHDFEGNAGGNADDIEFDSLYEQAKEVVLNTGNASTTFLQRKLKIGYARAASLMDQLEKQAVVGPADGSKPRKIFSTKKEEPANE